MRALCAKKSLFVDSKFALRAVAAMPTFSEFAVHAVRRMSTDDSAGGGQKPLKLGLDYLKRLAQLERIDADCFRANFLVPGYRKALNKDVYGGLMFAQAVAAAEATTDGQFAPHAAHSLFTSKAFTDRPIEYSVTKTRDGRSFCTRKVEARQDGRIVLSAQISLCVKEPSAIEHQEAMPEVPSPETVAPFFDTARDVVNQHDEGRTTQNATIIANLRTLLDDENQLSIFEFRPVHPDIFIGFRRHSPTPILYWLKCLVPLGAERTNKALNRFLLAFITDATMASTANRPHTSHGHQPSMVVTLDHVVHFHSDDFSVDEWLLCENSSPIADGGRALTDGRIWDRNGRLLLTARQESLIRSRAKETSKL